MKFKSNVKIVSEGSSATTKIFVGDTEVKGVTSILLEILPGNLVKATVGVVAPLLDILIPADEVEIVEEDVLIGDSLQ